MGVKEGGIQKRREGGEECGEVESFFFGFVVVGEGGM